MARIKQLRIYQHNAENGTYNWSEPYDIGLNENYIATAVANSFNNLSLSDMGFYRFSKILTGTEIVRIFNKSQDLNNFEYDSQRDIVFVYFNGLLLSNNNDYSEYTITTDNENNIIITLTKITGSPTYVFDDQILELVIFRKPSIPSI